MRIWHQSTTEIDSLGVYKETLIKHAKAVLGNDVSLSVHGMPDGRYHGRAPSDALGNPMLHHVILEPILSNVLRAEEEGYDAFVIGSFSEPFLRELRSAVDIPVVSITEASLLVACSLGKFFAAVSNAPTTAWMTRLSVETHGFGSRVLQVTAIDPPLHEPALAAAFQDPTQALESFRTAALKEIQAGADVIIPAEGMLAELLWANGVHEIEGATVVDVFGTSWAYADMMGRLRRTCGTQVSRRWHYRRADPDYVRELVPKLNNRTT
jgi:Asp/Glu/hydantoin racemase